MIKIFITFIFIIGCSSNLSVEECNKMNWEEKGKILGKMGHYFHPEKMAKGCDDKKLFSQNSLKKGYDQGIRQFCSPESGKYSGLVGRQYFVGCPKDLEPAFRLNYNKGFTVYLQRKEMNMNLRDRNLMDLNRQLHIRTGTEQTDYLRSHINLNRIQCRNSGQCPIGSLCEFDICRMR